MLYHLPLMFENHSQKFIESQLAAKFTTQNPCIADFGEHLELKG